MKKTNIFIVSTLLLSLVSLFFKQVDIEASFFIHVAHRIDFLIAVLLVTEITYSLVQEKNILHFIRKNSISLLFAGFFLALFAINKMWIFLYQTEQLTEYSFVILIVRNIFLLLKVFTRVKHITALIEDFSKHPAQTILLSFLMVILLGTILLMIPFTSATGTGLSLIDGLFTSTSAVCVTGLIVVDTASVFTIWGKLVVLLLIQIGGLGIMLLSFYALFVLRRSFSFHDKLIISYMLSEEDLSKW